MLLSGANFLIRKDDFHGKYSKAGQQLPRHRLLRL